MDGCWSGWVITSYTHATLESTLVEPFSEEYEDGGDDAPPVSIDSVLPDDMLEKIFACLPVASIFRIGSVCKKWHDIVKSPRFLCNFSRAITCPKPWYFMFTCSEFAEGCTYDPVLRKWYSGINLPCIESSSWIVAASHGLVCFMDNNSERGVFVCNPITRRWKGLGKPLGKMHPSYNSLAMWVDRSSHGYTIAIAKTMQKPGDLSLEWNFSVHVYRSEIGSWVTCLDEVLYRWRGGAESAICDGILYCLMYSPGVLHHSDMRHALVMYDLSNGTCDSLLKTLILAPCPLSCGRLINMNEKLMLVGGIGRHDRADIIKGIGVWELVEKKTWCEVSRMPNRFFQGFGEFDDVFASSGSDELIYIQSYGSPALLVFDLNQKQWKWSLKCPVNKKFPLQLFSGFCFEPRLEISP